MKPRITIDYKHFSKADFDGKTCGIYDFVPPNRKTATKSIVYNTASCAPLFQNQHNAQSIVTFQVEFLPHITGKHLLIQAYELVQNVLTDKFSAEPLTYCVHKKDGSIDSKVTINDVFIQKVQLFVNRKNEAQGEMGYIRIRFTLQGLHPGIS